VPIDQLLDPIDTNLVFHLCGAIGHPSRSSTHAGRESTMQLATTATTAGPRDKSSWPAYHALPAELPAPARATTPKFPVHTRYTAGSFADAAKGYAGRIGPEYETADARMLGRDPRAALAAAAVLAGQKFLVPISDGQDKPTHEQTIIGLYQAASGAMFAQPLWETPGTNDIQHYYPVKMDAATTPDARVRFSDDRLVAVVGTDGFVANPAFAKLFEG
jgi:hypothetical protein